MRGRAGGKGSMGMSKICVALGFHVNYNHSYRGDTNDGFGFGHDTAVIRDVVAALDRARGRGLDARGVWDFDNYWSIESCMKTFAPDLLDSIVRRVRAGDDEVILDSWANTIMSAMTHREFTENLARTISNDAGGGVADVFGAWSPVIRTQETMFTHGMIEILRDFGVRAVSLYYSAVPFDSFRNFAPKLTPNRRFNPLSLRSTESDAEILVIPTYHQGDIIDNVSLLNWMKKIRAWQKSGDIPGNALLYLNMDADADVWTGVREAPKFLRALPNLRGLDEFIETVNRFPGAEFCALKDYIEENEPAGRIDVRRDTADGAFTGYQSWAEKTLNQKLWRLLQRGRSLERAAAALLTEESDPAAREEIDRLLYGKSKSWLEHKIKSLSTTHFGLASPMIHPDRQRVAYHYARSSFAKAETALNRLAAGAALPAAPPDTLWSAALIVAPRFDGEKRANLAGDGPFVELKLPAEAASALAEGCRVEWADGAEAPADVSPDGKTLYLPVRRDLRGAAAFFVKKGAAAAGPVRANRDCLTNGLIESRMENGRPVSLTLEGKEFAADGFLSMGLTHEKSGRPAAFVCDRFSTSEPWTGPNSRAGGLTLRARMDCDFGDRLRETAATYRLTVFAGLPYLFVDGLAEFPLTTGWDTDHNLASSIRTRFDARWKEAMPFQIHPAIFGGGGGALKVWKHNFLDVTNSYELDFGDIDERNKNVDAFNNHITDGWVAVSGGGKGLLVAHDQTVNSSPAMCPMRLREEAGTRKVWLNPFGTYYGDQLSHLYDGSGVARELIVAVAGHLKSTAPTFNGEAVAFRLMLAPYTGDRPPAEVEADAAAFSLPPVALERGGAVRLDPEHTAELAEIVEEHGLEGCEGWEYADFLASRNSGAEKAAMLPRGKRPQVPPRVIMKIFMEGLGSLLK